VFFALCARESYNLYASPSVSTSINYNNNDLTINMLLRFFSTGWSKWKPVIDRVQTMAERGDEAAHTKGGCSDHCKICALLRQLESAAGLRLLGCTGIEDKLQALVPGEIGCK
jgi:hypothetical protein